MINTSTNGYVNGLEHLIDEKQKLDLFFSIQVKIQMLTKTDDPAEQLRGLIISDVEIERIIENTSTNFMQNKELQSLFNELKIVNEKINSKLALSIENEIFLPIPFLIYKYNLTLFEQQCLLLALAPELDKKYEKLLAYIQNDVHLNRPTIDLLLKLTCSTEEERTNAIRTFHEESNFLKFFVDQQSFDFSENTLMSQQIKLDQRIVSFILSSASIDKRLFSYATIFYPNLELAPLLVGQIAQEKMLRFIKLTFEEKFKKTKRTLFYLEGNHGSGKNFHCQHLAKHFNKSLLTIDMKKAMLAEKFDALILAIIREATLQNSMILLKNIDALMIEDDKAQKSLQEFMYELKSFSDVVFISSEQKVNDLTQVFSDFLLLEQHLPIPSLEERDKIWSIFSEHYEFENQLNSGVLASKFRFTPGQIKNALYSAEKLTEWNEFGKKIISEETLYKACYLQVQHNLEKKATRLSPRYTWEDLILPEDEKLLLMNACNQIKYRNVVFGNWGMDKKLSYGKGLSILLSGPPGTGKTMSAEVIAMELNLEIYRVDLSQVVSKYIGETEKNLKVIFDEAKLSNAILFFDETDALFGKRSEVKDSKDKYANLEVSYLLQKMEEYDGITVLATNYLQNIDEAFLRRISYIIKYPFPDEAQREKIWRSLIPEEAPTEDINYKFLANKFHIAGGNIKNIIVSAAFLAAGEHSSITMKHIIYATRHEMQKSGKVLLREDLGEYYDIL